MLIFSSRDLDDLGLHVVHLSPYLLQVLLHPFAFAFVVPLHLVGDDLRVTVKNHACDPYYFGEIKSYHQSFVLCFIVGGREVEADHTFNLVFFRRKKHDTCPVSLPVGQPVCMYTSLKTFICSLVFPVSELCYEVSDDWSLDCGMGGTECQIHLTLLPIVLID